MSRAMPRAMSRAMSRLIYEHFVHSHSINQHIVHMGCCAYYLFEHKATPY
jgi:hypothetical protein